MQIKEAFSKRRVRLMFVLTLINIGFAIFCTILSHQFGFIWLRDYNALNTLAYVLAAYLALKEILNWSRVIYLLTSNIGLAVIASYVGREGSVEFVYMFNIGLPFILFSFRREKYLVFIFTLLPLLFWTILYLTDFDLFTVRKLDKISASEYIYPISIASTIFLVIFQLIYFCLLNMRYFSNIRKKRVEALEASEAKSQFLSTMSHEIRTPLNAIIGLSHILADNEPRKDQLENINALSYSGKILLNLLNNVLDFSKMQSTNIELDPIPTDLSLAVKQIKKIHEASCLRKGIEMKLDVDDDIPILMLDIVRYNQIVNNLVSNAIKFTDKGKVTLKIKKYFAYDDNVEILTQVTDTGIGIEEDKQQTIWEAFSQASNTTSRIYGGTGLGLPIVKSIVETMDSEIKVESEIGEGSTFYFILDLKVVPEQELEKKTKKRKNNLEGIKVLLVEDNLINVMVGQQILEKAKLIVDVANDGMSAVEKIKEKDYDVVLMDIQMPVMDGYTATKEIRKFNKELPILALSASVFMEVKDKISASGMNGFIFKPFNPEDLLDQIHRVTKNT
uniref:ATP-binding protein n=1 Tax=uncultured Polaribacter sp. TaxID=174711 RepID=UPI00262BEEDF|nr:ATP-binding protein [uncultured Polaribacter sp.]